MAEIDCQSPENRSTETKLKLVMIVDSMYHQEISSWKDRMHPFKIRKIQKMSNL